MVERCITLQPWEAKAFAEGRATALLRVMTPQPPHEASELHVGMYHPTVIRRGEEEPGAEQFGAWTPDGDWAIRLPFGAPGDVLLCREAFSQFTRKPTQGEQIFYRADGNCLELEPWWSAAQMPKWAVRTRRVIERVRVLKVSDLTFREIERLGGEISVFSNDAWCWFKDLPPEVKTC